MNIPKHCPDVTDIKHIKQLGLWSLRVPLHWSIAIQNAKEMSPTEKNFNNIPFLLNLRPLVAGI